jgi:hypothetical protein
MAGLPLGVGLRRKHRSEIPKDRRVIYASKNAINGYYHGRMSNGVSYRRTASTRQQKNIQVKFGKGKKTNLWFCQYYAMAPKEGF